jgi:fatty acid desaturase
MTDHPVWNALTDWKKSEIKWEKIRISPEEMKPFTRRSDWKGLAQAIGFLLFFTLTGGLAWLAFSRHQWGWLALALYFHGSFYGHFGNAIHELGHSTVFANRRLNIFFTTFFGLLYWTWNPHLYRISHTSYHHRYTLYQGSDGEDTPNYMELNWKAFYELFIHCLKPTAMLINLSRLLTLKPTSFGWHYRGKFNLTPWEQFILREASEKDRNQVYRFARLALITHVVFVAICIASGLWFLPVLITFAPFYGAGFHSFYCSTHQHTACEANHPDYRVSCGDAILDPLSSFLYWHMEYHIEHHMFASIPCYNLKAFSKYVADQLPPKEYSIPRLLKLHGMCLKKYGTYQYWRDHFGFYKEF